MSLKSANRCTTIYVNQRNIIPYGDHSQLVSGGVKRHPLIRAPTLEYGGMLWHPTRHGKYGFMSGDDIPDPDPPVLTVGSHAVAARVDCKRDNRALEHHWI